MTRTAKRDYYEILGLSRDCGPDEIKRAYRRLAVKYHPDHNPDNLEAEEAFKEASEAYSVLSDAEKRRRYDHLGHSAFGGSGEGGFEAVDFGAISDILEGFLGDVFGRRAAQRVPRDLKYELELEFHEAALGVEKSIEVRRSVVCDTCEGSGAKPGTDLRECAACHGRGQIRFQRGLFATSRPCSACDGRGVQVDVSCPTCHGKTQVERLERLRVKVPPGVEDGAVRTLRGAGERTPHGAGNLHVHVRVKSHDLFRREGPDIHCEVPLSFPQAALGSQIEVPTLEGRVKMKVPAGTQSGKTFRLRGKGLPVFGGYGKGDQLVKVIVEVPEKLSGRQRELLELLASEMDADTHPQQRSFLDKLRGWLP